MLWYEYNGDGRISAVRDLGNRRVEYAHGPSPGQDFDGQTIPGGLATFTDVRGYQTHFTHQNNKLIVAYPGGSVKTIAYDIDLGRATALDYDSDHAYPFDYDYNSSNQEFYAMVRTPEGAVKETWYRDPGDSNASHSQKAVNGVIIEETEIQDDGRTLLITDENGNVTRRQYNEW